MDSNLLLVLSAAVVSAIAASPANAAEITVPNYSFESPIVPANPGWLANSLINWSSSFGSNSGVNLATVTTPALTNVTGNQCAFANINVSIWSAANLHTITAGDSYTLKVDVAGRTDFSCSGFQIQLIDSDLALLAGSGAIDPPDDALLRTHTLNYSVATGNPFIGKGLRIRLVNAPGSNQASFDNVRLSLTQSSAPPAIILQPVGGVVNQGGSFIFTSAGQGGGTLGYQWLKNQTPLPSQESTTLNLANLSVSDNGDYALQVTSGQESVTSLPAALNVNRPPVAAAFTTRCVQDQTTTLSAFDLLTNCSDADGDTLAVASVSSAVGGSARVNGDRVIFLPTAGFTGAAQFAYTVSDLRGGTVSALANIEVIPSDAVAPVATAPAVLMPDDSFHATYLGIPNNAYSLQFSTTLANWQTNPTAIRADAAGHVDFEMPTNGKPRQFFRVGWEDPQGSIAYTPGQGASAQTHRGAVALDSNSSLSALTLAFLGAGGASVPLTNPTVLLSNATHLSLQYDVTAPGGAPLRITSTREVQSQFDRTVILETMTLTTTGAATWSGDIEIRRPFSWKSGAATAVESIAPLTGGWGKRAALTAATGQWQYQLGYAPTSPADLALPVMQFNHSGARFSVMADPYYTALIQAAVVGNNVEGEVRYTYRTTLVPLAATETRTFAYVLADNSGYPSTLADSLGDFYTRMTPDVPPGPDWCKQIAMVSYDYLSENGAGWTNDVNKLTEWLTPAERARTALCFHGWYESLGNYSYDSTTGGLKSAWNAMKTKPLNVAEIRNRLSLAKNNGFRVLFYFADGMLSDDGAPGYRPEWEYRDLSNNRVPGWTGPDTFGLTYAMNPAHPDVANFFSNYLAAVITNFGDLVDGFVWDETFYIREGATTLQPAPAYCDVAFMKLAKRLRDQVKAYDPQKVFLTSDAQGYLGNDTPGYAIVTDGTYQDSHCNPIYWSYGLFANWRNTLWSCNWAPITNFDWTRYGALEFGSAVAISNGWLDEKGPSEWTTVQRDMFLSLFRKRLTKLPTTGRFLQEDPATYLASTYAPTLPAVGDTIPAPAPGETNWAAAANGGTATASSTHVPDGSGTYPPSGAIDGIRTDAGWGSGHGWGSMIGAALPVSLQVDYASAKNIKRFVVITYQGSGTATAGKYGILNYRIQIWNNVAQAWQTVVTENRNLAMMNRVHSLDAPVNATKCRLIVDNVSGGDGIARVLQLEAWGTSP